MKLQQTLKEAQLEILVEDRFYQKSVLGINKYIFDLVFAIEMFCIHSVLFPQISVTLYWQYIKNKYF